MEIKVGNIVKTYELNTGEIAIGEIEHILDKNVKIECWRGTNELMYSGSKKWITILPNTIIWDKRNKRYVFKYYDEECACFSTIVVDCCSPNNAMWRMLVDNEKIKNRLH